LIKTKRELKDVETTLEVLEACPPEVAVGLPADQVVRAYLSITFENVASKDIELAHMTFKVEKEWLEENSVHKWSVVLNQYDPRLKQWLSLPTKRVKEDDTYVYYSVVITRFSDFAISGSRTVPPPQFKATNLVIDPVEAEAGEAITISADITNHSDAEAIYIATLWIDGTIETGKNVSIEAGGTVPVTFTVARDVEDNYQVRVDQLFESFTVTKALPAPSKPWWVSLWWIWQIVGIVVALVVWIMLRRRATKPPLLYS